MPAQTISYGAPVRGPPRRRSSLALRRSWRWRCHASCISPSDRLKISGLCMEKIKMPAHIHYNIEDVIVDTIVRHPCMSRFLFRSLLEMHM